MASFSARLRTAFTKYGNRVAKNKHTSMKTLALFYKMEARELQQLICPKYFYKVSLLPPTPQRALSKTKQNKKAFTKIPRVE